MFVKFSSTQLRFVNAVASIMALAMWAFVLWDVYIDFDSMITPRNVCLFAIACAWFIRSAIGVFQCFRSAKGGEPDESQTSATTGSTVITAENDDVSEKRAGRFAYFYSSVFTGITALCICSMVLVYTDFYSKDVFMCVTTCLELFCIALIAGSMAFTGWRRVSKSKRALVGKTGYKTGHITSIPGCTSDKSDKPVHREGRFWIFTSLTFIGVAIGSVLGIILVCTEFYATNFSTCVILCLLFFCMILVSVVVSFSVWRSKP